MKNIKKSFSHFFHGRGLAKSQQLPLVDEVAANLAKVKNFNLNVTEVRDSDLTKSFPGIFNFTVGILVQTWKIAPI